MKIERNPLLEVTFGEDDLWVTEINHPKNGIAKVIKAVLAPQATKYLAEFIRRESSNNYHHDNIVGEIHKKKRDFTNKYNLIPTIIYLGENEFDDLSLYFALYLGVSSDSKNMRLFDAMVVKINRESHVGFGV